MNKWLAFLQYAREHPDKIPKSTKRRAEIYRAFLDSCRCGVVNDPVCDAMKIQRLKKDVKYSASKDPMLLKAKIQAYEDILAGKDAEIEEMSKYIFELEKELKSKDRIKTV